MMGLVYSLARSLKRSNMLGLRKAVNLLYWDPEFIQMRMATLDYVAVDDCKFRVTDQIDSVQRVKDNPWFRNIKTTDVCLDVGANIGAITIPLAKTAYQVYAVEPLFGDALRDNIQLNGLNNVTVLDYSLGKDHGMQEIAFSSKSGFCKTMSLARILEITGPVDWVKIDCEGAEWLLEPAELQGIREIRIEFHIRRSQAKKDMARLADWEDWMVARKYNNIITYGAVPGPCVPYEQCILFNASLELTPAKTPETVPAKRGSRNSKGG